MSGQNLGGSHEATTFSQYSRYYHYFQTCAAPLCTHTTAVINPKFTVFLQKKNGSISANDRSVRKISGAVLLSHSQIYSTIAAGALNYRVREGNVCDSSAMDTGKK